MHSVVEPFGRSLYGGVYRRAEHAFVAHAAHGLAVEAVLAYALAVHIEDGSRTHVLEIADAVYYGYAETTRRIEYRWGYFVVILQDIDYIGMGVLKQPAELAACLE